MNPNTKNKLTSSIKIVKKATCQSIKKKITATAKKTDYKKEKNSNKGKSLHKIKYTLTTKVVKRKQYSNKALDDAIVAARGGLSYRKAAEPYSVSASTLFRRVKFTDAFGRRSGPPTVLTNEEEDDIVKWIIYRAETGSPVTKTELFDSIQKFLNSFDPPRPSVFKQNRPGKKCYTFFKLRHPNISLSTAQNLPLCRANVTEEKLRNWFSDIKAYLTKKQLLDIDASRVFNCDETNFAFCSMPPKVLAEKGAKSVYNRVDAAERENITTLFTYNAKGLRVNPLTLFVYKKEIPKPILEKTPPNWSLRISDSGWMTTENFYEFVTTTFHPFLEKNGIELPVILYLDGHASHVTMPLVNFCRAKQIELITLYPHSTHITQPLDIAFFHPLKDLYKNKAVPAWRNKNKGGRILKEDFCPLLHSTLELFENEATVIENGFKAAGLCPFNPDAVSYNVLNKKKKNKSINQCMTASPDLREDSSSCKNNFLTEFEKRLSSELLVEFQNCGVNQDWTGDIKNLGLFEFWKNLVQSSSVDHVNKVSLANIEGSVLNTKAKPIITSIKKLSDDNRIILPIEPPQETPTSNNSMNDFEKSFDSSPIQISIEETEVLMDTSCDSVSQEKQLELKADYDKKMTALSNILSGNIHISPMKEDDILSPMKEDDILSPKESISQPHEVIFATECTQTEINCLLGQNSHLDGATSFSEVVDGTTEDMNMQLPLGNSTINSNNSTSTASYSDHTNQADFAKENTMLKNPDYESKTESFNSAFTPSTMYLPKPKRIKVENSGKPKLPSVGTSDEWLKIQQDREEKRREKEQRAAEKKELQRQKKRISRKKQSTARKN